MPARLQLIARTGHPDFLDLPWDEPLEEWTHPRLVEVVRGIHRHVVRFVEYEGELGPKLYALKELPVELARREYRLLRALAADEMPVVEAVGVVVRPRRRPRRDPDHAPPRLLASVPDALRARQRPRPAPAAARRGRGAPRPPPPRRLLLGRLLALEHALPPRCGRARRLPRRRRDGRAAPAPLRRAAPPRPRDRGGERRRRARRRRGRARPRGRAAPEETAADLVARYESLWDELLRDELFGDDTRYKIDERLHRLNELGFDVEELELVARRRRLPAAAEPARRRAGPSPAAAARPDRA